MDRTFIRIGSHLINLEKVAHVNLQTREYDHKAQSYVPALVIYFAAPSTEYSSNSLTFMGDDYAPVRKLLEATYALKLLGGIELPSDASPRKRFEREGLPGESFDEFEQRLLNTGENGAR